MQGLRLLCGVWLALALGPGVAGEADYRVAGILDAKDSDSKMAVIELPDGEQGLFRPGDPIGNGRVLAISRRGVWLGFPDGERLLPLQGDGSVAEESESGSNPGFLRREVSPKLLQSLADVASRKDGANGKGFRAINAVLKVPLGARIISVQDQTVDSAQTAARRIRNLLQQGNFVRIALDGVPGMDALYLFPMPEADVAQQ